MIVVKIKTESGALYIATEKSSGVYISKVGMTHFEAIARALQSWKELTRCH